MIRYITKKKGDLSIGIFLIIHDNIYFMKNLGFYVKQFPFCFALHGFGLHWLGTNSVLFCFPPLMFDSVVMFLTCSTVKLGPAAPPTTHQPVELTLERSLSKTRVQQKERSIESVFQCWKYEKNIWLGHRISQ